MMSLWQRIKDWRKADRQLQELRSVAIGMNSGVDIVRDAHIIMLDYDIGALDVVEHSIKELMEFWGLSDAWIFKTRNGFHVFFWYDQIPFSRLRMIIEFARDVDPMYKYISKFYDYKTIRVAGKYKEKDIKFVKRLSGRRLPSQDELVIGEMKRKEHISLLEIEVQYGEVNRSTDGKAVQQEQLTK